MKIRPNKHVLVLMNGTGGDTNVLPDALLCRIFQALEGKQLMKLCRVCQRWKRIIVSNANTSLRGVLNEMFRVNGKEVNLATFKSLSLPWKRFRFEGFNLETSLFASEVIFRRFSLKYCPRITELKIDGCEIPTGRLYELLAFCNDLQKLTLSNSPSIYKPDVGLFRWKFCHRALSANLAKLTRFELAEQCIAERDLLGLAYDMEKLNALYITTEVGFLPVHAIGKILEKNADSLKFLTLRGQVHNLSCPKTALFPLILSEMKQLSFISLQNSKLTDLHMIMLKKFLSKCSNLSGLSLHQAHIASNPLASVLPKLKFFELSECTFGQQPFSKVNFEMLEILRISKIRSGFGELHVLFGCPMPRLQTLEIISAVHPWMLNSFNPQKCPNLREVHLQDAQCFCENRLEVLFYRLRAITTLSITSNLRITDELVCPKFKRKGMQGGSLGSLTELVTLDLSGTSCGDKTVSQCILGKMTKLRRLNLADTKVTSSMLGPIVKMLPNLVEVTVTCPLPARDIMRLSLAAPHVVIICPVVTTKGEIVRFGM